MEQLDHSDSALVLARWALTMTQQYRWGSLARHAGQCATNNPFTPLSESWLDWADGWKDTDEYLAAAEGG